MHLQWPTLLYLQSRQSHKTWPRGIEQIYTGREKQGQKLQVDLLKKSSKQFKRHPKAKTPLFSRDAKSGEQGELWTRSHLPSIVLFSRLCTAPHCTCARLKFDSMVNQRSIQLGGIVKYLILENVPHWIFGRNVLANYIYFYICHFLLLWPSKQTNELTIL